MKPLNRLEKYDNITSMCSRVFISILSKVNNSCLLSGTAGGLLSCLSQMFLQQTFFFVLKMIKILHSMLNYLRYFNIKRVNLKL